MCGTDCGPSCTTPTTTRYIDMSNPYKPIKSRPHIPDLPAERRAAIEDARRQIQSLAVSIREFSRQTEDALNAMLVVLDDLEREA